MRMHTSSHALLLPPHPHADVTIMSNPAGELVLQQPALLGGSIKGRVWRIAYTATTAGASASCVAELCRWARGGCWRGARGSGRSRWEAGAAGAAACACAQ